MSWYDEVLRERPDEIAVSLWCFLRCNGPFSGDAFLTENEGCIDSRYVQAAAGGVCECACHAARAEREAAGWR